MNNIIYNDDHTKKVEKKKRKKKKMPRTRKKPDRRQRKSIVGYVEKQMSVGSRSIDSKVDTSFKAKKKAFLKILEQVRNLK